MMEPRNSATPHGKPYPGDKDREITSIDYFTLTPKTYTPLAKGGRGDLTHPAGCGARKFTTHYPGFGAGFSPTVSGMKYSAPPCVKAKQA